MTPPTPAAEARVKELEPREAKLRAALEKIMRFGPIMGSTGDYREGQLHALEVCSECAKAALAELADKLRSETK